MAAGTGGKRPGEQPAAPEYLLPQGFYQRGFSGGGIDQRSEQILSF